MALIYDVGMHKGEDTAFYLHQGHTVVAIEANPELAASAANLFQPQIKAGRLVILNTAIAERAGEMDFWICEDHSDWSSFSQKVASRNGSRHHNIKVKTGRLEEILTEFGCPEYLKVDIEGNDYLCLLDLNEKNRPRYVSIESNGACTSEGNPRDLMSLRERGYERFKLISQLDFWPLYKSRPDFIAHDIVSRILYSSQRRHRLLRKLGVRDLLSVLDFRAKLERQNKWKFPVGSSGPWGSGTPGRWLTFSEAKDTFHYCRTVHFRNTKKSPHSFWCDWHATRCD